MIIIGDSDRYKHETQGTGQREAMFMTLYSFLTGLALLVSAPWWLWRMATSGRYREGLSQRLGLIPATLRDAVAGKPTVWVHVVSVGEVLAVERLIAELRAALPGYVVAVSTTTATGQRIARERLAGCPVFFFPLDFAFAVRAYLHVLRPSLMVLVESEFWPRHLAECERAGVPVAVVNARVSDRSFPRYMRLRKLWTPLFAKVAIFLAQGEESAERLRSIGAPAERVRVSGNLKYDMPSTGGLPTDTPMTVMLRRALAGHRVVVAGSTVAGGPKTGAEEEFVLRAMEHVWQQMPDTLLILAPRHPERFAEAHTLASHGTVYATELRDGAKHLGQQHKTIVLDTLGDLASVYSLANAAFIGGSLVQKGGHNPLEAARLGVPVLMGPSYENFREIVEAMRSEHAIEIVRNAEELGGAMVNLLTSINSTERLGERGRSFFHQQVGATHKTANELIALIGGRA